MQRILKKLRNKPERAREQIAVFAAGGVTLLIIAIWALSLANSARGGSVEGGSQPVKPFELFFQSVSEGLKEERKNLQNPLLTPTTNEMQEETLYDESFLIEEESKNETALESDNSVAEVDVTPLVESSVTE